MTSPLQRLMNTVDDQSTPQNKLQAATQESFCEIPKQSFAKQTTDRYKFDLPPLKQKSLNLVKADGKKAKKPE